MKSSDRPLFAYGSLLNLTSLEATIGRKYTDPRPVCVVEGWRRCWNTAMPNEGFYEDTAHGRLEPERISYANVRACAGERVNGVLYFIDVSELAAIDEREWTYDRIAVPWNSDQLQPSSGEAYMYVAKPEWILAPGRPRSWAAIRQTYLETIQQGVASLGAAFKAEFVKTTDPIPEQLILRDTTPFEL
jgi:gamma-glutamylcyclotransferase (GGCT)/AIG2-like uncharacterized protein YtfP